MDVSGFVWVLVVAAVVIASVLLATICLDCGNKGPLVSIRQGDASEEYIPSPGFRLIHPYQQSIDPNTINPPSTLLSPFSPALDLAQRHHSFTLTENESNPSYENPTDGPEYVNAESDGEEPGYVKVLPDPPEAEIRQSSQSLASTHSSVDVEPNYVNVDPNSPTDHQTEGEESDDRDYLNVVPLTNPGTLERDRKEKGGDMQQRLWAVPRPLQQGLSFNKPAQNMVESDKDSDDDDDDDSDEGNYVNQPPMIVNQPTA